MQGDALTFTFVNSQTKSQHVTLFSSITSVQQDSNKLSYMLLKLPGSFGHLFMALLVITSVTESREFFYHSVSS